MGGPGSMLVQGWPGRHGYHGRRSWSGLRSRPCGESWHEHLGGRCLVAEGCMRPDGIVMTAPALDDDLRLAESVEDLAVEQLVPEPGIKALDIAILPRAGCRRFRAARARPRSRPAGHRRRDNPALSRALGPACAACQTDAQSEVT